MPPALVTVLRACLRDPQQFIDHASGLKLRQYQVGPAQAICKSVICKQGLTFVILFPRQSGKNELQAQIEAYLLTLFSQVGAEIVKVSPTYKPQTLNAMRRLEKVLTKNIITNAAGWSKEEGYIYRLNLSRIYFFSGHPTANIVGATASTLLEVDEAQDVLPAKYDKDVAPMAASTNATRVFWGTAWTSSTLLARELRASQEAEQRDGIRRVWRLTAEDVAAEVPAYKSFVADQVARLGRNHPLVKTQFYSEEIDGQGGMFPPERRAMMQGTHPAQLAPVPGALYALLLDVAGEDSDGVISGDAAALATVKRDATALTVVQVDLSTLTDPVIHAPRYLVVDRRLWIGAKQTGLYAAVRGLVDHWRARFVVVDATGIGAGLSSFLTSAYPDKVLPFIFSGSSKSALGWDWLAVIESGRYKEHAPAMVTGADPRDAIASTNGTNIQARFWHELESVQMEVQPGPERRIKWGTPNGAKDAAGEYIHDDLVLSSALCAVLDGQAWAVSGPALVVQRADPMKEMDKGY